MSSLNQKYNHLRSLKNRYQRHLLVGAIPLLLLLGVLLTLPLFADRTAEAETLTIANTPTELATSQPKRVAYFPAKATVASEKTTHKLALTTATTAAASTTPKTAETTQPAKQTAEWGWPYTGGQHVTSTFGDRDLADSPWHDGVDFNAGVGSKIRAVHAGEVIFVGNPTKRGVTDAYPLGLGKDVVVTETADGDQVIYQEFAMNHPTHTVHVGDTVKVGQVIATQATGHLHLGVTNHKSWVSAQNDWQNPHAHSWKNPLKLIKAAA